MKYIANITKNYIILTTFFIVIIYLIIGAVFYVNDIRYSRTAVRICPPGVATSGEIMQDCQPQTLSLKEDWPTAITLTVGWLPILIILAIGG